MQQDILNIIKHRTGPTRIVQGEAYRHGVYKLEPGTRYEGCSFVDAVAVVPDKTQVVHCDLRNATLHLEGAAAPQIVGNRWCGNYVEDESLVALSNEQRGGRAAITGSGPSVDAVVAANHFESVDRAILVIVNHGDITNWRQGYNVFASSRQFHSDANRRECVLFHGSDAGLRHQIKGLLSYRDNWTPGGWSPVAHGGDFDSGSFTNPGGWKKAAIHLHLVNAEGVRIERPTWGEQDVVRLVADSVELEAWPAQLDASGQQIYPTIRNVAIVDAPPGRGAVSRHAGRGIVTNIVRTDSAGNSLPIID